MRGEKKIYTCMHAYIYRHKYKCMYVCNTQHNTFWEIVSGFCLTIDGIFHGFFSYHSQNNNDKMAKDTSPFHLCIPIHINMQFIVLNVKLSATTQYARWNRWTTQKKIQQQQPWTRRLCKHTESIHTHSQHPSRQCNKMIADKFCCVANKSQFIVHSDTCTHSRTHTK